MINPEERKGYRTWIELDTQAIASNIETFRALIDPEVKLLGVVKSNAYGHGLVDFTKHIVDNGVDWLGVDSLVEGQRLRKEGITKPMLVLGYTLPELIAHAADADISIAVSHSSTLEAIKGMDLPKKIKVHIKVDTGMYRQGFLAHEVETVIEQLKNLNNKLEVEGLFTHFSSAKNPSFPQYTQKQIELFEVWREAFKQAGFTPIVHASATAGTILFPQAHYDMVRIGIGLYGLWPSSEVREYAKSHLALKPVLSWKTIVSEIKKVPKDERVGYDGTEILRRDSILGVCPIGYWHGFPRALSSIGEVLVNGAIARVVGRVAMDMIVVDLTDCGNVKVLDEVVLIGKQNTIEVPTERVASLADASWYEIITRLNPLIKKIFF
jgi:alanine racemase